MSTHSLPPSTFPTNLTSSNPPARSQHPNHNPRSPHDPNPRTDLARRPRCRSSSASLTRRRRHRARPSHTAGCDIRIGAPARGTAFAASLTALPDYGWGGGCGG